MLTVDIERLPSYNKGIQKATGFSFKEIEALKRELNNTKEI
jgi:hypothetical protein